MRCDAMSQWPAMSFDVLPWRCDAMSMDCHTTMQDDAMRFDAAWPAMACDGDVEGKRCDVRFMPMPPDIGWAMEMETAPNLEVW